MRNATVTTVLDAPEREVFEYMADIRNLPEWATEFARELRREGNDYKVRNRLGEFFVAIDADPSTGVIDTYAGPSKEAMAVFPRRTVSLPDGRTAFSFTSRSSASSRTSNGASSADDAQGPGLAGTSANAIAFPSGSGIFTWRTPFE